MTNQTARPPKAQLRPEARRFARLSLWMFPVFILWTIVYIVTSGPIAKLIGADTEPSGEVHYIEAWLPWIGVSLLWVLPLVAGIVLAVVARAKGAGRMAWLGLALNAFVLVFAIGPALIDRFLNL